MTTTRDSIRCEDGTEIPFVWIYEDGPQYEWMRDRAHWTTPMTPMERWLFDNANPGIDRAWDEVGLPAPPTFRRFQFVGPFMYVRMTQEPPERMMVMAPAYVRAGVEHGGALNFWQSYCEPRIKQAIADLAQLGPDADLRVAAELWLYGFHQTFTSLALMFIPGMQMTALVTEAVGAEDAELTGYEVTQGGDNATQAIDAEIWQLAEMARGEPAVATILASQRDDHLAALRAEPKARGFVDAFDALIARHRSRSMGWMLQLETWGERPDAPLALVRAQLAGGGTSPDVLRERSPLIRAQATERVLAALPQEKHEEFLGVVRALDGYVSIREGRAYQQMVIVGQMRLLLLRVGAALASKGRIDSAHDILFLTGDDIAAEGDLRDLVAERRTQHDRNEKLQPPPVIGTPGDVAALGATRRAEFRGAPASRGTVTGIARILRAPDEAARLQPGEILVCVMTTPAWTPLFAIAGGIVTETGGALSHPAITAREYGIPAVVALPEATQRIKDGQRITIDGGAGTVTLADAPVAKPTLA